MFINLLIFSFPLPIPHLKVVTDSEPSVRHRIRITEVNRETGEVTVSEEVSSNASVSFEFVSGSNLTSTVIPAENVEERDPAEHRDQKRLSYEYESTPGE